MAAVKRNTTIKDVAKLSGVSFSTVSRVINGNYPVSKETKAKVEKAIKECGYRQNVVARSLKTNKTKLISLIIEDMSNIFFMDIAKGIENIISKDDYILVIASSDGDPKKELKIANNFLTRRVDGLIIASAGISSNSLKNYLNTNTPILIVDRVLDNANCSMVIWENEKSSYLLTEKLIKKGHKKIGIVNGSLKNNNSIERLKGFNCALEDNGIKACDSHISKSNYSIEDAYSWVNELIRDKNLPTGLFCANNIMAKGALKAILAAGLKIPKDISVVSFGKLDWNEFIYPGITTAEQDSFAMGKQAGALMRQEIEDNLNINRKIILDPVIVERGSILDLR